ncbi:uncharacterized protein LOC113493934 [Trichoplusia ni]|uniref:Uncharacterized protein LOC113493934 n=1 Tax=Trichoplusia ni TaxID=7111 RepID=A0A7E5VHJ2_TRINI|nr:uncharacterized protein LOC113493934 [Trichoplusia ni]
MFLDFFFNHPLPRLGHIHHGMKCVPGRTLMKVTERQSQEIHTGDSESDEFGLRNANNRRTHMRIPTKDEYCRMCVCSADGKTEHCLNRPAETINECLQIAEVMDNYDAGIPYEHTRALSNRLRRDYLWHNDEIPYNPKAKCYRGHSYYSNSLTANNTDIDIPTDVDSLLNYDNDNTCFFCICSVDGTAAGCIHRDVQYCNFFRVIRDDKAIRDRYTAMFEQDRPSYFRQLSWRMRRTMDNGMYDMIANGIRLGGDTLCCNHPDGHRRQIHNDVRNKLRTLKKRLPKENLLGGSMRGDYNDKNTIIDEVNVQFSANAANIMPSEKKCVPFVSEYSTCNDDNMCTGCTKCTCTSKAQWSCDDVKLCEDIEMDEDKFMDQDEIFDNALDILDREVHGHNSRAPKQLPTHSNVPDPPKFKEDNGLLGTL